jgi:hypothetical protein
LTAYSDDRDRRREERREERGERKDNDEDDRDKIKELKDREKEAQAIKVRYCVEIRLEIKQNLIC